MLTEKEMQEKRKLFSETDRHLAATFKALGDVTRFRIFHLLTDHPQISVSTIAKILHISPPLASQHVKGLVHAQLLTKNRVGKKIFLQLDGRHVITRELKRSIQRATKATPAP